MQVKLSPYNLPDIALLDAEQYRFMIWQPQFEAIVLGQSNKIETAIELEEVYTDKIPVMKRPSGGQTVLLSPKTLVVSAVVVQEKLDKPHQWFKVFNQKIIQALKKVGVNDVSTKGISDLAIGVKKILGSSIYRKGNKILYHAVLNIAESPRKIGRYLSHPSKEPDYRAGRSHEQFVTSLFEAGHIFELHELQLHMEKEFEKGIHS
jgi:lipoate-protein ligase A